MKYILIIMLALLLSVNAFAQKGYGSTTLDDIAGEVGIKAPGIFRHFKNKQALYEAVVDRLRGGYVAANAILSGQFDPLDTLDGLFEYNRQQPNLEGAESSAT